MKILYDLLRSDGSVVVNKKLARNIGLHEAMIFSELLSKYYYFKEINTLQEDGSFFCTVENLEYDTTLSKFQQSKAIKKLVELNLLKTDTRGLPAKRYFYINLNEKTLYNLLKGDDIQKSRNLTTSDKESEQLKETKKESIPLGISGVVGEMANYSEVKKLNSNNTNLTNNTNFNNTNEKDNGNEKMFPSELPRENEKSFSLNNSIDIKDKDILETKRLLEDINILENTKDYSKYYRIGDIDIIDKLKDIIDIDKYILVNNNKYYIKDYSKMFLELYKIYCKELPSVRTFSNERQKVFKKFTKEYTPSEILHGLELISQSDFLKGKSPNSTWSANIDWIMKLGNFEKILSGVYNRTSSNGTTGGLKDSDIKKAGNKMGYEF